MSLLQEWLQLLKDARLGRHIRTTLVLGNQHLGYLADSSPEQKGWYTGTRKPYLGTHFYSSPEKALGIEKEE
jgi:hypothetical protein